MITYSLLIIPELDPRAEELDHVSDLNTGKAFLETHYILIDPTQGEQLIAIPFYIDGASISQFHQMEVVSIKIGLGIMTRDARKKNICGRPWDMWKRLCNLGVEVRILRKRPFI